MTDDAAEARSRPEGEALFLSVHPSVVFKLGADLITDDVQALLELVKNSYDADSPTAAIDVDTMIWTDPSTGEPVEPPPPRTRGAAGRDTVVDEREAVTAEDAHEVREVAAEKPLAPERDKPAPVRGRITVTDRGTGMSPEDIRRGWLTLSASEKRRMKREGRQSPGGRSPLGDKGLGRLGAQRLGDIVEIDTRPPPGSISHHLQLRWSDFDRADSLQDVPLRLESTPSPRAQQGTTLTIRGLREPARWSGSDGAELERELSAMLSPFGDRGFRVSLRVDGTPADLRRRHEQVRQSALVRYELTYAQGVLRVAGQVSTAFFRPNDSDEMALYQRLVESDNGATFRQWLLEKDPKAAASMQMDAGDGHYFLRVGRQITLARVAGVRMGEASEGEPPAPIDPGPFSGEVDAVALRTVDDEVFSSSAEYRNFVKAINGVRIYRDGFGIRVDRDWIGLAARWSSGASYYGLRPENVVGYIDLTSEHNGQLVETTNREGFQDTPAYQNFRLLIEGWRQFTEQSQTYVRRAWVTYREAQRARLTSGEPRTRTAMREQGKERQKQIRESVEQSQRLSAALAATVADLSIETGADLFGPAPDLAGPRKRALVALEAAEVLRGRLEALDAGYGAAVADLESLSGQISAMHDQLSGAWEAVSLGITAEALAHEIHQIADRLRARSQQALRHLSDAGSRDTVLLSYVEHVRSSAAALNRQMSYLDPALRYMRERRSTLVMSEVTARVAEHFTALWQADDIAVDVTVSRDFQAEMNEGKLTQVLDNLVLNSGYWIREQQRQGVQGAGRITMVVDAPFITVSDNGPGVDPAVEGLVFEPFVTTKNRGQGRGLGLFVVRQLLEPEGARIDLDPPPGEGERRRTFRITFASGEGRAR